MENRTERREGIVFTIIKWIRNAMARFTDRQIVNRWSYIRLDQIEYKGEPCIDNMTEDTLDLFNTMCRDAEHKMGWRVNINSSYRPDSDTGQHPKGRGVDYYFYLVIPGDVDVWKQYRFAKQYPWGGIGAYPFWKTPGLHSDTRQGWDHIATWWRDATKHDHGMAEAAHIFGVMV